MCVVIVYVKLINKIPLCRQWPLLCERELEKEFMGKREGEVDMGNG